MKQTLMLLDKSGLRRGKPSKGGKSNAKKKGSFVGRKKVEYTAEQKRENEIKIALETGIGYNQYKKEVDAIRAQKIRERLEKDNKEE